MMFRYNDLIEKFADSLGTPKYIIEETFAKPDRTDVAIDKYISVKDFGEYSILIIFDTSGNDVNFLRAFRIYHRMLDGASDPNVRRKMKPLEMLTMFMEKYGICKAVPGHGEKKILIDKPMNIFFPGILDIEKYLKDADAIQNGPKTC
jgi:hypothetical protein